MAEQVPPQQYDPTLGFDPPQEPITPATVTIGTTPPTDFDALYQDDGQTDDEGLSVWTDYKVFNRYESDKHTYMLALTNPGGGGTSSLGTGPQINNTGQSFTPSNINPATAGFPGGGSGTIINLPTPPQGSVGFVRLGYPTLLWIADFTCARQGVKPEVPYADPDNTKWVLLDETWEPAMVTYGPNGRTIFYRISGTMVFGHRDPDPLVTNDINYGRPPWLYPDIDRTQPPSTLTQDIINIKQRG